MLNGAFPRSLWKLSFAVLSLRIPSVGWSAVLPPGSGRAQRAEKRRCPARGIAPRSGNVAARRGAARRGHQAAPRLSPPAIAFSIRWFRMHF